MGICISTPISKRYVPNFDGRTTVTRLNPYGGCLPTARSYCYPSRVYYPRTYYYSGNAGEINAGTAVVLVVAAIALACLAASYSGRVSDGWKECTTHLDCYKDFWGREVCEWLETCIPI